MERFDVKRGVVKQVSAEGGLAALASRYFENVESSDDNSFAGSHDIMVEIDGHYDDKGALFINVRNVPPNFDDPEAMKTAMDSRRRWIVFLDDATGYNSKQRGDKAKQWGKKASKAKSAVSAAHHFIKMASDLSADIEAQAQAMITEIEEALEANDNTRAFGRGEKLNKLLNP